MALVIDGTSVKEYFNTNKEVIVVLNSTYTPNPLKYTYVGKLDNALIYAQGRYQTHYLSASNTRIRLTVDSDYYVFQTSMGIISLTCEGKTIIINKSDLKQVALWLTVVIGVAGILSYFDGKNKTN